MCSGSLHTLIDALYKQSFGGLLNSLLRQFPDLGFEEAEDILQETFSSALTHWQPGNTPQNPKGWLYMVAKNKAIDLLKYKSRFAQNVSEENIDAGQSTIE